MKLSIKNSFALVFTFFASTIFADDGGLKTSAAFDIVSSVKLNEESAANDKLEIREAEFSLFGPLDHNFEGVLSFAAHQEQDGTFVELHEAYLSSSKIIPRSRLMIGQFFLGVGRLNRIHRHDWPFTEAPYYHTVFFAEEAAGDSGIEYTTLLPSSFFLELKLGVTNGFTYGHAHGESDSDKPRHPLYYVKATNYFDMGNGGSQWGLNYLKRKDKDANQMSLVGLDWVSKWRKDKYILWLIQAEVWDQSKEPSEGDKEENLGAYLFIDRGFNFSYSVGLRLDYFTNRSLKDANGGDNLKNHRIAFVPQITYHSSEFVKFRLSYSYGETSLNEEIQNVDKHFTLQITNILGAHPAHEF